MGDRPLISAESIVLAAERSLCEERQVHHFRTLGSYGIGDTELATAVGKHLEENPIPPGAIVTALTTGGYLNPTVLQRFIDKAKIVVSGLG